jgi:hypothetical protein
MRRTLLDMTQHILSAMDSDEVNSISDTIESMQVAELIRQVYYDVSTDLGLPEHETLIELNASGDNLKPVLMNIPEHVTRVSNIMYDIRGTDDTIDLPDWKQLKCLSLNEFITMTQAFRGNDDVGSMQVDAGGDTFEFLHYTDRAPTYFMTFDDQQIIFDAYDRTLDTTLQKSKTLCYGSKYSQFMMQDNYIPDLDPTQFSYFINKAKVRAFAELKQQANQEAAGEARRQKIIVQKRMNKAPHQSMFERRINYGR